MTKLFFKDDR